MKKRYFSIWILSIFFIVGSLFVAQTYQAQAKETPAMNMAVFQEQLEKVESQLQLVIENQEVILSEIRILRAYIKRS